MLHHPCCLHFCGRPGETTRDRSDPSTALGARDQLTGTPLPQDPEPSVQAHLVGALRGDTDPQLQAWEHYRKESLSLVQFKAPSILPRLATLPSSPNALGPREASVLGRWARRWRERNQIKAASVLSGLQGQLIVPDRGGQTRFAQGG